MLFCLYVETNAKLRKRLQLSSQLATKHQLASQEGESQHSQDNKNSNIKKYDQEMNEQYSSNIMLEFSKITKTNENRNRTLYLIPLKRIMST